MIECMPGLPTLDLRDFHSRGESNRERFVDALRETAHGIGFFCLIGHGVEAALQARAGRAAQALFALPAAAKSALHMVNSPHFRGYTAAGDEITRGMRDWREQLDLGAERPPLPGADAAHAWRRLQGPNLWPEQLPDFRAALQEWQHSLTAVGLTLMRALALCLGQRESEFDAAFMPDPVQHVKIIRYPGRGADESRQGVGAHKDSGFLTLLLQVRGSGLQVLAENHWIDVPPREDSLVVNLGEALEMLSGGFLRATQHRVLSPCSGTDRLSVAFFLGPRLDAELTALTLPPALAARVRCAAADPCNPLIAHAGKNFLKGRLRSHPEVAARFYPDVAPVDR
jgi:isopenicillin N synthase-like dioxygenase